MQEPEAIDAALERLRAVRWLTPDAEMASLDASAREAAEARIDEVHGLLGEALGRHVPAPRVRFTRALEGAFARWDSAWREAIAADPDDALAVLQALRDLTRAETAGSFGRRDGERVELTHAARVASRPWALGFGLHQGPPGERALVRAATSASGPRSLRPSCWWSIFALWERGVWPVAYPGGAWEVIVPATRDGLVELGAVAVPAYASPCPGLARESEPLLSLTARLGVGPVPRRGEGEAGPWLVIVRGPHGGFWRVGDVVTVGSDVGSVARLAHPSVARFHARLARPRDDGARWELTAPSGRGVRVNGVPLRGAAQVGHGDRVTVGDFVLRLDGGRDG